MRLDDGLHSCGIDCRYDWLMTGLTQDSRQVQPGDCFCAVRGHQVDGRLYIDQAIDRGAAVVLYDGSDGFICDHSRAFSVNHLDQHLSQLAAHFYGYPSKNLTVYAVTGTNGKSSVVHALAHALDQMGERCWQLGTLGSGFSGQWQLTGMTTPGPIELQHALSQARDHGATAVAMEVSSHALDQGRVDAVVIDVGILTQISSDHLDYHHNVAAYVAAKSRLFQRSLGVAVYNMDDDHGRAWSQLDQSAQVVCYGFDHSQLHSQQWCWRIESANISGMVLQVRAPGGMEQTLQLPLIGDFNVANVAAATAALVAMGHDVTAVVRCWENLNTVPGRMQCINHPSGPRVIVDYAHTKDALSRALIALRAIAPRHLWCVFGCGGNRDQSKRSLMLKAALAHADKVVLTCDNPRDEPPMAIINDMMIGLAHQQKPMIELDRAVAITKAIQGADDNDIILIAGKGHEKVQIIGEQVLPFCDIDIAKEQLRRREQS